MIFNRTIALLLAFVSVILSTVFVVSEDAEEASPAAICRYEPDPDMPLPVALAGFANLLYPSVDSLMQEAAGHLGVRYRLGGTGPLAFDCSGFTSYVFKQQGIRLQHSSSAQYMMGTPVQQTDLQQGDLVFFRGRESSGVGHVGIVTETHADGTFSFIHASTNRGVVVTHSSEPYYVRRYVGARRIIAEA